MPRLLGWLALLGCCTGTRLAAQTGPVPLRGRWAVGLSIGVSSFSMVSQGKDADGITLGFAPYRPTLWGLAVGYGRERLRLMLTARYGQAGLSAQGVSDRGETATAALIVTPNALHLTAFTAALSTRLVRLRGGPSLRPSLALGLERWTGAGSPTRTIAGGQGGLTLEVILTRALVAALDAELGYTPASPFRREDLPEGFQLLGAWRRTLAGALYWRF